MHINVKLPTSVGILAFMTMKNKNMKKSLLFSILVHISSLYSVRSAHAVFYIYPGTTDARLSAKTRSDRDKLCHFW